MSSVAPFSVIEGALPALANGKFGIALLVNNLFDKRYVHTLDGQTKPFGLPYAIVTPPRTVSLELRGSL